MLRFLAAILLLCISAPAGRAQSTLDSACADFRHHDFDFWVGSWTVTDTTGRVLGTNDIVQVADGCALREHWRGTSGTEGMSLNVWQPALGRWAQFWVGAGAVLHLTGGLDPDGRMVLAGERSTPEGPLLDRITWTPLRPGSVRQWWDVSRDGGATWRRVFDGLYTRTAPEADSRR